MITLSSDSYQRRNSLLHSLSVNDPKLVHFMSSNYKKIIKTSFNVHLITLKGATTDIIYTDIFTAKDDRNIRKTLTKTSSISFKTFAIHEHTLDSSLHSMKQG